MTEPKSIIELHASEEADRLWNAAEKAWSDAADDILALAAGIDFGMRAVELRFVHLVQPKRHRFPATITSLLELPPAELDIDRDALRVPKTLGFLEVVDMTSDLELDCVDPPLHHGWEDRYFSCERSRKATGDILGFRLTAEERQNLLVLLAYRNRIFRLPPPVRIVREEIMEAFPTLVSLAERLAPGESGK